MIFFNVEGVTALIQTLLFLAYPVQVSDTNDGCLLSAALRVLLSATSGVGARSASTTGCFVSMDT